MITLQSLSHEIKKISGQKNFGSIDSIKGNLVMIVGVHGTISIGDRFIIESNDASSNVQCEVVGFEKSKLLAMPYGRLDGISVGARAIMTGQKPTIFPDESWKGRVLDSFAEPADDKGILHQGNKPYSLRGEPPPAHMRNRVGKKVDLGIRALNCFTTLCEGQRMGIFAGSGVGKSVLMSMVARHAECDVIIIGMVGERGRELREFIEKDLGEEGLKKSVIVVGTSDQPALVRRETAYTTLTIAEYFRDQGHKVLLMVDSITRFAMAQREIGLSVGEPPSSKSYTPTVFSELPKLMERAGPGLPGQGSITALFTVLVEGDDHNEPISDAVRGILDGHIVLDRAIAHRNRYPAINILQSLSRTMPDCNNRQENYIITRVRELMAAYENMEELIKLGAYRKGSDSKVDEAILYRDGIENFLNQSKDESTRFNECYQSLADIVKLPYEPKA